MKKKIPGLIICMLLISSTLIGSSIGASDNNSLIMEDGTISVNIPIDSFEIKSTEYGDEITVEDFGHLLIPGKPNVPTKIYSIAIPPGAEITDLRYETSDGEILDDEFNVPPVSSPGVAGRVNTEVQQNEQKIYDDNYESVYLSDEPYPASIVEFVRNAGFRKYNLVDVRVNPFTYNPLSKELVFYSEIKILVDYTIPEDFSTNEIMIDNSEKMETLLPLERFQPPLGKFITISLWKYVNFQ